ncbi:MAG: hypothetical protein H8D94_01725 [Candidatus Pelagibacter sp.]|nr:hypothetical protein [Candidatus Pelagibacter sp.]
MNTLKTLKRLTIGLGIFYLGILASQTTTPPCPECVVCENEINVWYKVSSTDGKIIKLDLSGGKSYADGQFIYIWLKDMETNEGIIVAFPNGGEWVAQTQDPFLDALDKEFKDLEEYLRNQQGKGTKLEKEYK